MPRTAARTPRSTACALVLALLLVGCSSDPRGVSADPVGPTTLRSSALSDPRFWYGDAEGSLFAVTLHRATVTRTAGHVAMTISGTAENLLTTPGSLRPTATVQVAGRNLRVTGGTSGEVAGSASARFRLVVRGVPGSARPEQATLTLGPARANRVTVALGGRGSAAAGGQAAPRLDLVPTAPTAVAPGVTLAVTSSILYPRFESGRAGQYRLWIPITVKATPVEPSYIPQLHPSLTTPDGTVVSVGDQYVLDAVSRFVERAVLVPPIEGRYVFTTLEVTTGTIAEIPFAIPPA